MFSLKPKYKIWRVFDQPIGTFVYFSLCVVRILYSITIKGFFVQILVVALLYKNLLVLLAVRISSYRGYGWEVWRAPKKLELLSAAPLATLTHFSCSPNFPRASITRYTHAKHKQILKSWKLKGKGKVTFPLVLTPRRVLTYRYAPKSHSDNNYKLASNLVLAYKSSMEHLKLSYVPITYLNFENISFVLYGLLLFLDAF